MQTLKKLGTLILNLFVFSTLTYSQENGTIQNKEIHNLERGLQLSDYTLFQKSLSSSFTAGSHSIAMMDQVIPQILAQYPSLISLQVLDTQNNISRVEYNFKNIGKQVSNIHFDSENKISKIELFDNILNVSEASQKSDTAELISSFTTKFELVNNLIFVEVKLNGKIENFILDSGAPAIILNSHYFESEESDDEAYGVSGSATLKNIEIESFDWNGIRLENTNLIGMNLSHLEEKTGKKFKGLIGFSVLKDYELYIDYKKHELSLLSQGNGKLHTEIKPKAELSFEYGAHLPIIETTIDKTKYKLGIDTGASSNLIDISSFDNLPKKTYKVIDTSTLFGADKNETETTLINIKTCTISNKKFKKMEFVTSDISHLNKGYGLEIDGLVGYPFLSEQKTSIDFLNKKIYFWK
ncbi:MAG: aspartyl protease family protein [Flavobacteriaceae bacterium]|nr:aspartyl protease family protein [Flavobacteriaceae bacterium]